MRMNKTRKEVQVKDKTSITIEKGVPLPPLKSSGLNQALLNCGIGDSFIAPPSVARNTISSSISILSKKHERKYTTRTMPDGTIRIWRIV